MHQSMVGFGNRCSRFVQSFALNRPVISPWTVSSMGDSHSSTAPAASSPLTDAHDEKDVRVPFSYGPPRLPCADMSFGTV